MLKDLVKMRKEPLAEQMQHLGAWLLTHYDAEEQGMNQTSAKNDNDLQKGEEKRIL